MYYRDVSRVRVSHINAITSLRDCGVRLFADQRTEYTAGHADKRRAHFSQSERETCACDEPQHAIVACITMATRHDFFFFYRTPKSGAIYRRTHREVQNTTHLLLLTRECMRPVILPIT